MAKHGHIHTRFNAHSKATLSPTHKGYKRCLPVKGGGGGLQQQLGAMPFGGPMRAPAPSFGGGGGGPTGPGSAALPRGGHT